jgi:cell pole-organizing protein PopZ
MNAPNPLQDEQAAERKAYEPSMEEILASIRRIIADDQSVGSRHPAAPKEATPRAAFGAAPAGMTGKAWDLQIEALRGEAVAKSTVAAPVEVAAPDVNNVKDSSEVDREVAAPQTPPPEIKPKVETYQAHQGAARSEHLDSQAVGRDRGPDRWRPSPATQAPLSEDALVSPATDAAVSAAFDTLVASRFLHSNELISDMVHEMLRPMLKAWLDDNLPILVERLVRAEIERVARGGR